MADVSPSIASIRTRGARGLVALTARPGTAAGSLLGSALLADSSPASTHHHVRGQRLVTSSLAMQWAPRAVDASPSTGWILRASGSWPYVTSTGRILDADGRLVATSRSTFMGLTGQERREPTSDAAGQGTLRANLDAIAEDLVGELGRGWRSRAAHQGETAVGLTPELRNRFGPMHGAAAYTVMALACHFVMDRDDLLIQPFDSYVRFLRPIASARVVVSASSVRRSRSMDVRVAMSGSGEEELALGHFVFVARG